MKIGQLAADGHDHDFAGYFTGDEIFAASIKIVRGDFHAYELYVAAARRETKIPRDVVPTPSGEVFMTPKFGLPEHFDPN